VALGPEIIQEIHQRVSAIEQEQLIVPGRRQRLNTTVVDYEVYSGLMISAITTCVQSER
jgi:hypothetical protein